MQSHGDDENWVDEEDDELIEVIDRKEIILFFFRLRKVEKACVQEADSASSSTSEIPSLDTALAK